MKKILVVSPYTPYPPDQGGEKAIYYQLECLARQSEIFLICPEPSDEKKKEIACTELKKICKKIFFYQRSLKLWRGRFTSILQSLLLTIFKSVPEAVLWSEGKNLVKIFSDIFQSESIDVVHVIHAYSYCIVGDAIKKARHISSGIMLTANEQNIEHHVYEDAAANPTKSKLSRWIAKRQARKMFDYTAKIYSLFDKIIYLSPTDCRYFREKGWNKNLFVGNVMLPIPTRRKESLDEDTYQIIFSGGLGYFPNEEGILWFYENVWPIVRNAVTKARLVITGNPTRRIRQKMQGDGSVELTGFVDKQRLENYLLQSDVFISPVRLGSGIKMKNIEAMSYGLPIVATSESMQGILVTEDLDVLIADTAEAFAKAVQNLLTNRTLRKAISENAYSTFLRDYTCENGGSSWHDFMK